MAGIGKTASIELEAPHLRPLLSERIPAEVWLQVIEDSNFIREDITNLTLVSKFVRWISQPLLFRTITLSIHKRSTGSPGTTMPYLERAQERLAFCTQHRIAHGVKSVVIRAEISGTLRPVEEYLMDASPLIEAAFTSLPYFPNIHSFSISNSNLNGRHFDVLAQLPRLSGLHFNECSGTGDLRLSRFHLTELSLHGTIGGTFGWWISLIKPSTLRRLSYSSPSEATPTNAEDSLNLFFPAVSIGPRLSNLTVLHLPFRAPKFQCYTSALQRCPNIEVLIIEPELVPVITFNPVLLPTTFPFLPPSTLPKLRAVNAPYAFVTESLIGRQLKHVRIEDTMGSTETVLNLARKVSSMQELVISVDTGRWERYADLLRGVFGCLTGLHSLHIRIEGAFLAADINQVCLVQDSP
ncbi:hypothetical protein BC629DRAFT_1727 [Irpex lacteus]|nr:hypothetical protein BC629DRAFT_1727 [Irpex lacteus]